MRHLLLFLFSLCILSCIKPPDFPDEPVITFTGLSKMSMQHGALNQDSLKIFFSFTDGDGDLGTEQADRTEQNRDLFVIDTRSGNTLDKFHIPYIPPKGAANGIQGTGQIVLFTTCCSSGCDPDQGITDEVIFEIYVIDRSGKQSSSIFTSPITLICD